jgi:hypothetical protein
VLLRDTHGLVEQLRAIKDREEQEKIRRSIRVNERAFEVLRAKLEGSMSERQIAYDLEHQMRAFGATQAAFKPIIAGGPRSALPHAIPSDHLVNESPFLLVDWGALVEGYASDLTRVLITGKAPAKYRKIYEVVLEAQRRAISAIRPGATLKEVDREARVYIESAGYGKYFGHGLGHGFGLQVHEIPFIGLVCSTKTTRAPQCNPKPPSDELRRLAHPQAAPSSAHHEFSHCVSDVWPERPDLCFSDFVLWLSVGLVPLLKRTPLGHCTKCPRRTDLQQTAEDPACEMLPIWAARAGTRSLS